MKNSKLIAILFFSFLIFTSRPALVEETLVNSKNLPEALNDIFATKYVNYYLNDNNFFQKYKRTKYELLAEIIKYYKRNKIDINKPVNLGMKVFFHNADILGLAILTEDSKLVELLLNNGVKVKSKYVLDHRTIKPLILNKSMAEILIPRGASVPKIDATIEEWVHNPQIIDKFNNNSNEIGVEYIKYLFEHGATISQNTLNVLETNLRALENDLVTLKRKHYKFFKDIKKYVEEKLNPTQKK